MALMVLPRSRCWKLKYGELPDTLMAKSPSGSVHRYYKHPGAEIKVWNSDSEIAPGVDIRGDGGMAIAPPSVKPGVGQYKWLNDAPVANAPVWLIEAVSKPKHKLARTTRTRMPTTATIRMPLTRMQAAKTLKPTLS